MSNTPILNIRIDEHTELRLPEEDNAQELFALIAANRAYLREWLYDHFVDLVVYSMLEDEWRH